MICSITVSCQESDTILHNVNRIIETLRNDNTRVHILLDQIIPLGGPENIDTLDKDGNFNAIGFGMMIWGNYLHDLMVKTSSTLAIRSFASFDPEQLKVFVYLINKMDQPQLVHLQIEDYKMTGLLHSWQLVGKGPDDCDPVWKEITGYNNIRELKLEGTSITLLEYKLKNITPYEV